MLEWIVRILFVIAAPITALFVSRNALNFGLIQTFVTMLLVTGLVGLVAAYSGRSRRAPH
ncbi:LDH2 family malate/lactate/ureidoglycolate dehydrogenase [Bradyrhizobium japonicum]|jgi:hypothetical protein|uniref:Uncharacterized protein n=2 Tax=Bradyrhizobium TaxID=374 RepID=A0A7Z0TVE0_9BRAD|nr:hypothetical protein [Bradyrhizobium barranii]UGX98063.1 hypothetical protein G6321_00024230 [Bradyrhizobium barranii subsp. barranii]